jgi:hypothetical protein
MVACADIVSNICGTYSHLAAINVTVLITQRLMLDGNDLHDFAAAPGEDPAWLRHLTELDLSDNWLAGVPPALAAATSLRQLHIQHQWLVSLDMAAHVA